MKPNCAFWNLQRLFEPRGGRVARSLNVVGGRWTPELYERKLNNIAGCLKRLFGPQPALLGLAEIETPELVEELRQRAGLDDMVSVDSQTPRPRLDGLDVALLYSRSVFETEPVVAQSIALNNRFATRDLLRVRLRLRQSGQEIEVLVAHWPSRVIAEGESLRMAYSAYLHRLFQQALLADRADLITDEGEVAMPDPDVLRTKWATPCFIMGDFNDEPFDPSIRGMLDSVSDPSVVMKRDNLTALTVSDPDRYLSRRVQLYNPCWHLGVAGRSSTRGTYYRSPEWRTYDQVLTSHGALVPGSPCQLVAGSVAAVLLEDFEDDGTRVEPGTATGLPREFGADDLTGVSDHLPITWSITTT